MDGINFTSLTENIIHQTTHNDLVVSVHQTMDFYVLDVENYYSVVVLISIVDQKVAYENFEQVI